ncbi:MAG: SRPBCC domain-containing protein [Alphaproteobacteria bacterium]|nr:SRPBCC domain-containing protein [Alphaproteobacteria bacterium]
MTDAKSRREAMPDRDAAPTLSLERRFKSPRETVFRAWTEPERMAKWFGPDGCTVPVCEIDLCPGGAWRACILSSECKEHFVGGVYLEIDPPEYLSFTWAWETDGVPGHEMVVAVEFHDRDGSTEMIFHQTQFDSSKNRDDHERGWSSSFECLERTLIEE